MMLALMNHGRYSSRNRDRGLLLRWHAGGSLPKPGQGRTLDWAAQPKRDSRSQFAQSQGSHGTLLSLWSKRMDAPFCCSDSKGLL